MFNASIKSILWQLAVLLPACQGSGATVSAEQWPTLDELASSKFALVAHVQVQGMRLPAESGNHYLAFLKSSGTPRSDFALLDPWTGLLRSRPQLVQLIKLNSQSRPAAVRRETVPVAYPVSAETPAGIPVFCRVTSSEYQAMEGGIQRSIVAVWRLPENNRIAMNYGDGEKLQFSLLPGRYRLDFSAVGTRGATFEGARREITITADQPKVDLGAIDLPISVTTRLYGREAPELKGIVAWKNTEPLVLNELRGKVVVFDFFAFYCSICHAHKPDLARLYQKYADQGLVVLAMHDNSLKSIDEMNQKMDPIMQRVFDGKVPRLPIGLDGSGDHSVFRTYGIRAVPAVLLIDQQGRVVRRFHHAGVPELEVDIQKLLERPANRPRTGSRSADPVVVQGESRIPEPTIQCLDVDEGEINDEHSVAGRGLDNDDLKDLPESLEVLKLRGHLAYGSDLVTEDGIRHLRRLKNLRVLHANGLGLSDQALESIRQLTLLEELELDSNEITSAGLRQIADLKKLRRLSLNFNRLEPDAFETIAKLPDLEHLSAIGSYPVNDDVLELCGRLKQLQHLRLSELTDVVTDFGVAHLTKLKRLKNLAIRDAQQITDAGLRQLAELSQLEELEIHNLRSITPDGLSCLGRLTELRSLGVSGTVINERSLIHLTPLQKLESLTLWNVTSEPLSAECLGELRSLRFLRVNAPLPSPTLRALAQLPNLETIRDQLTEVTDEDLRHLARLPKLQELILDSDQITAASLDTLAKMKSLRYLWVTDRVAIPPEQWTRLGIDSIPDCRIARYLPPYLVYYEPPSR